MYLIKKECFQKNIKNEKCCLIKGKKNIYVSFGNVCLFLWKLMEEKKIKVSGLDA